MTKLYSTTNPQALIDLFEQRAQIAENVIPSIYRGPQDVADKRVLEETAKTWRAAADILRNTEFVGWNVGMIVDEVRTPAPTDPVDEIRWAEDNTRGEN